VDSSPSKIKISDYQMWVLVGSMLGWRIVDDRKHPRMYSFFKYGRPEMRVHHNAVQSLVFAKLISETILGDKKLFHLTPEGFDIAHDRIKETKPHRKFLTKTEPKTESVSVSESHPELFVG
jgi:hypothetical protein